MPAKFPRTVELEICEKYKEGRSLAALGAEYDCCLETVRKILKRHDVPRRQRGNTFRQLTPDEMAEIGRRWLAGESQTAIAISLRTSQPVVSRALRRAGFQHEKRPARGARHGQWKGGRVAARGGYVYLHVEPGDPLIGETNDSGYILEHRYVMAVAMGRPLRPGESVHHINGVKTDNRLENLQLRQRHHGAGVVMKCVDCGSHNLVEAPID
jgi:hypothetical protein